ncbi:MAG: hypothetical protein PVH88_27190 [Ignavibacteria bacterium]|jgi:hypothetical protein
MSEKYFTIKSAFKYFIDKLLLPIIIALGTIYFTNRLNESEEKINKFNALITFTNSYFAAENNIEKKQLAARALYAFDEKLANDWFIDLISNNENERSVILDVLSFAASKYSDEDIVKKNIEIIKSSADSTKSKELLAFIGENTQEVYTKELVKEAIKEIEDNRNKGYFIVAYSVKDSTIDSTIIKSVGNTLLTSKTQLKQIGITNEFKVKVWKATSPEYKWAIVPAYGIKSYSIAEKVLDILINNGLPADSYIVNWK